MDLIHKPNMPKGYKGNGCGSDGWRGALVPDSLGGIDISEACGIHDYDYTVGGTEDDKDTADRNFLTNMVAIILRDDTWLTSEGMALKWAMEYFLAVHKFGKQYFNYHK